MTTSSRYGLNMVAQQVRIHQWQSTQPMCQCKIRLELQLFANYSENHSPEERAPQMKVISKQCMPLRPLHYPSKELA